VAPRYDIRWLELERVIEINYVDVEIVDDETFDRWRDAVLAGLSEIRDRVGGRVPLIVCTHGLRLAAAMGARYSAELAMPIAHEFATIIARYGASGSTSRVVAVEAMRRAVNLPDPVARERAFGANTFGTREEALEFVRTHRDA